MQLTWTPAKYYSPCLCVYNGNSVSTTVGVVLEGSAKVVAWLGLAWVASINDISLCIQHRKEVPDIILNFRVHAFVFRT